MAVDRNIFLPFSSTVLQFEMEHVDVFKVVVDYDYTFLISE